MAESKYPNLNRVLREVQEVCGMSDIDGLIGKNTEAAVAKVLADYDGNDVLGYLSDLPHKLVEQSPELNIPIIPSNMEAIKVDHPDWYSVAHAYIGLEEIVGSEHNETILEFWKNCKLPFRDDETPWCAGFVGGVLEKCGIKSTRSGMARSYLKWGKAIDQPRLGAIVVFWRVSRYSTSGHVGFVAGELDGGFLPTLGGNQGNKVCIKPYPKSRILGYRWVA